MNPRRILLVGPSGSGKTTIGQIVSMAIGVPLLSMDDFRTRGVRSTKYWIAAGKEKIRNFEHPDLWDGRAIAMKLEALIRAGNGFVIEGNHLLHYPQIAALAPRCDLFYLHVDHAMSVARRRTRHRYSPADESFIQIGEVETARWVVPQKLFPGIHVIDGTRSTGRLADRILNPQKYVSHAVT